MRNSSKKNAETRENMDRSHGRRTEYLYGSEALEPEVLPEEPERRRRNLAVRRNRDKAKGMSTGYVVFLITAFMISCFILISYINLQSQISAGTRRISTLENQLNDLKLENDEKYSRINSNVDLESVKKVAIGELGMKYASEGQVETFSTEKSDYVRQVADIPGQKK
jgi:cell division protein FtsL